MLWRLHRSGKQSSMRCRPGTRIRDATKFGLPVLRPFIDMSQAFRSASMATAMGSAASPIIDDFGAFELLSDRQECRQRCAALRFNKGDISARH